MGGYRFASRDAEPVFACLSGGCEKRLKLTFGLIVIDGGGTWPSAAIMKDAGHKIVELDGTVRRSIVDRRDHSTAPGLVDQLVLLADGHPGVIQILATLERYAKAGRFYNLDFLGGIVQREPAPQELWSELEMDIIEANPEMLDQFAGGETAVARATMNEILAWSLGVWCELIYRAWVTGVAGDLARQWSPQLQLGHTVPRFRRL